jgi:hypothetical protein
MSEKEEKRGGWEEGEGGRREREIERGGRREEEREVVSIF